MKSIKKPPKRSDGTCSACIGGWLCGYHINEAEKKYKKRTVEIIKASKQLESNAKSMEKERTEYEGLH